MTSGWRLRRSPENSYLRFRLIKILAATVRAIQSGISIIAMEASNHFDPYWYSLFIDRVIRVFISCYYRLLMEEMKKRWDRKDTRVTLLLFSVKKMNRYRCLYAWFRNYDNPLWNRYVVDSCPPPVSLIEGNYEFRR